jgi:hypothetical protein
VEGSTPGYVTILVEAELQPGGTIARHTHPGIESTYVLEGSVEIPLLRCMNPGAAPLIHAGWREVHELLDTDEAN